MSCNVGLKTSYNVNHKSLVIQNLLIKLDFSSLVSATVILLHVKQKIRIKSFDVINVVNFKHSPGQHISVTVVNYSHSISP